jgi:hypothetical protein
MQPNTDTLSAGSLLNRVTSPTPPFWLKLRYLWGFIAANSGVVVLIAKAHPGIVPQWLATAADVIGIAATSGFAHTLVAKQPVTNNTPSDGTSKSQSI